MTNRAPWSLQRRLVLGIVALLAVVGVIVGGVSVAALNASLLNRLDGQLRETLARSQQAIGTPSFIDPPSIQRVLPGLGAGALGALAVDGTIVQAGYISEAGEGRSLDQRQQGLLLSSVAGTPTSVDLGGDFGSYRLLSAFDSGGVKTVIGLPLAEVQETTRQLLSIVALVTALGLVVTAAAGTVVVRLALRPLDRVVETASRVAELPLARGEVALAERVPVEDTDIRTEVGKMGAALNRLLDHVTAALTARQSSENKLRQFVADASHELRTPLAAIRGYAELTRRSPHVLPDDTRHSLGRIESESVRMTALVEELLLLARLDEGRALDRQQVDVGGILTDATSDAHATSPDHEWQLDVPDGTVLVEGDPERLHQAIANLLANARTHTPPGTRVVAGLELVGERAVVTVSDDGPGIDPDLIPTLFERFVRGDSSRSRLAGGTGLGLAIVRAIVEAHGGAVGVQSEPGSTQFWIEIPVAPFSGEDVDIRL